MATKAVRGPGVRVLDTQLESISQFEAWKHSMVFYLRQDLEFRPYLKAGVNYGDKSLNRPHRDFTDDAERSNTPPTGLTAADKSETVDFMLETISQYTPLIPQEDILKCDCLNAVWQTIRLHNGIETTGALLNSVWNVTRKPNETPQALWSRLKQQYDDALLRSHGLTYVDAKLDHNEVLSPTLHNVIILHWLQLIHPKMRDLVTQRFS